MENIKNQVECITNWIKEQINRANKKRVVIGVSGGIDSAVSLKLAVMALGRKNVVAVTMPCDSNPNAMKRASKLIAELKVKHEHVSLDRVLISFEDALGITYSGKPSPQILLMLGNIKARIRMATLYALNEEYRDSLVLGTGNLSEHFVGYFTKWGDGAVDLEPLGNLLKSEVFEISRYLELPREIIEAVPSADLWEGQTDEMEMGFTYDHIDEYITKRISSDDYDIALERIHERTNHKRAMPPTCPCWMKQDEEQS